MNTIAIARRGLVPALLAFGLGAQEPALSTPTLSTRARTPAAAAQDGPDRAVEQLDALIARLRAGQEDHGLVRELEAIAKALKERADQAPVAVASRGNRRAAANLDPVRAPAAVTTLTPPVVSVDVTGRVEPVERVVEVVPPPDATVPATPRATPLRVERVVRSYPTSGVLEIGGERLEYRTGTDARPEVTIVRPDLKVLTPESVRVEVVSPEVRTHVRPVQVIRSTPLVTADGRRQVVQTVEDPAPVPAAQDLQSGLADIERELREIRELIEQIRQKAAQAPKKDR